MDNTTYLIIFGFISVVVLFYRTRVKATRQLRKNEPPKKEVEFVHLLKASFYHMMFAVYLLFSDLTNVSKYGKALLNVYRECGAKAKEKEFTLELVEIFESENKYTEAREFCERYFNIMTETGDRKGEGYASAKLGLMYYYAGEYLKAREYLVKALTISVEIGDKKGEATCHTNLGVVLAFLSEYETAKEYLNKALPIAKETGCKAQEAMIYATLGGGLLTPQGEYENAKGYLEKALAIRMEICDRRGEAEIYGSLGNLCQSVSEFVQAKEYYEKELAISKEIGDRPGEASSYASLGSAFCALDEYVKSKEYYEKALLIKVEMGDRAGEGTAYGNLGTVFQSLGEYNKAKECLQRALSIRIEIGDIAGEASDYGNLGTVFQHFGEHVQAKQYHEKALSIELKIGNKAKVASSYGNLGTVFQSLNEYDKTKEHLEKALAITMEIGDRDGEASSYGNLGILFRSLGDYVKAKEYHEKALAIRMEIGDREGEASSLANLGVLFLYLNRKDDMAEEFLEKALSISREIGTVDQEFQFCNKMTVVKLHQGKIHEALEYMLKSMKICENLRGFLEGNDEFKISFSDVHTFPYRQLCQFYCVSENPNNALYVLELGRARALADLMAAQYSVESQMSTDPQSWFGVEKIMKKESNCSCLYISYYNQDVFLWVVTTSGVIYFRRQKVNEMEIDPRLVCHLDDFFSNSFRSFGILPEERCEDRSLNDMLKLDLRLVEEGDEDNEVSKPSLPLVYKMLIAPVKDLIEGPEIIVVPEGSLYQVPFAALSDKDGNYLSENFRIRIVPSLTTLKLIQDSPADYHRQNGALVVGDPQVGRVIYKGRPDSLKPLPCARKEAEMIGRLLGIQPMLGEHATKHAVLEMIPSVSLIHFAAHGNAERGEIALAPQRSTDRIPQEEDYLLTMPDISKVQLRAKLVVLSCCHSGSGQIRAEGVVGIARAFLGSGARSVLVSLWAIEDKATEQLMSRFYEHLIRGKSASESLHEAMKWMRGNGFAKVSDWAPFVLIGDNVTFDFRDKGIKTFAKEENRCM